ncbi:MAG: helix-turn-helix transcriptional regulator, partial [Terriglobia bacterium]
RTPVWIQPEGRKPFVADQTVVTYYNRQQPYVRWKLSAQGDHCDWFQIDLSVLQEVVSSYDLMRAEQPDAVFAFSHGPCDTKSFLSERLVVRHIAERDQPDPLYVEETMVRVLGRCLRAAHQQSGIGAKGTTQFSRWRGLGVAAHAQSILAKRYREPLSLTQLAGELGCSVYHLCRAFRQYLRTTIHRYRNQLRLRESLDLLASSDADLTEIALAVGYSSHSHFTFEFRRTFGRPPSAFRRFPFSSPR